MFILGGVFFKVELPFYMAFKTVIGYVLSPDLWSPLALKLLVWSKKSMGIQKWDGCALSACKVGAMPELLSYATMCRWLVQGVRLNLQIPRNIDIAELQNAVKENVSNCCTTVIYAHLGQCTSLQTCPCCYGQLRTCFQW